MCDVDVISQEDLITYESLVREDTREYSNLVDSNRWEPANSKEKSQYQPLLLKAYTVVIDQSISKDLKQVYFKIRRSVNGGGSRGGSSARSYMTCNKCGKKGHLSKDYRSKGYGSDGNPPKKSANELQEWVTKKPAV